MKVVIDYTKDHKIDIFYRIKGNEKGFPIIFIHGLAGDSRFFHNQLNYFGKSNKTIAIDLPGHGRSSHITEQSMNLYNRSIEAVVEKENIDSYILAGHSMGGAVSIENYLKNKNKVKALILISTSYSFHITKKIIDASINDFDNLFNKIFPRIFHKKSGIFMTAAQENLNDDHKKIITGDLILCSKINYNEQLENIDIPVLLVANKFDRMVPAYLTEEMHWKIKNSKLVIFDDEGHVPFFENSDEFNNAVDEFIQLIQ
ncbi:MAG: alpha/beta hydrolase [Leptospirales bacterium]|nr:alpha/beta hydrolase [Leptospirales bacterium]